MLYFPVFCYSRIALIVFAVTLFGYLFTPKAFTHMVWRYFGENYQALEFSSALGHYNAGVFVTLFIAMAILILISFMTMLKTVFAYQHVKQDVPIVKYYQPQAMLNRKEVADYLTLSSKYEVSNIENGSDYRAAKRYLSCGIKGKGIAFY